MAEGQSADDKPAGDDKPDDSAEASSGEASEATSEETSTDAAEGTEETETGAEGDSDADTDETADDVKAEPAPAASGGSGGPGTLVPVAIAAVVALVIGVAVGFAIGSSGDDDGSDTEVAVDDDGAGGDDHGDHGDHGDHEDMDHGDDEHAGHEMGDLTQFDEEAEENGLVQLLEDHHWHGEDDLDDLSEEEQELLDHQVEVVHDELAGYETVADAEEDFKRAGPYIPGLGVHYIPRDTGESMVIPLEVGNEEDGLEVRPVLIFDGMEDDSELAGFMFLYSSDEEPEESFVGADGAWHRHTNLCMVWDEETGEMDLPFVGDQDSVTVEMCEDLGGEMNELSSYMIHLWSLDGWESEIGLYSEVNPVMTCEDGTYHRVPYDDLEPPYLTTCADGSRA